MHNFILKKLNFISNLAGRKCLPYLRLDLDQQKVELPLLLEHVA